MLFVVEVTCLIVFVSNCCVISLPSQEIESPPVAVSKGISKCSLPSRPIPPAVGMDGKSSALRNCSQNEVDGSSSKITELFEQYWEWKLSEYPEEATWIGLHQYDDRLTNISIESFNQRYAKVLEFLEVVEQLEPCVKNPKELQNLKLLRQELVDFKEGHRFNGYYLALDNIFGIQYTLPSLFERMPLTSLEDYQKMISRMENIPHKTKQIIALLKAGMAIGLTQHHHSIKGLTVSLAKFVVRDPSKSTFYKFFEKQFPASLTQQEISLLQESALNTIRDKVVPGFKSLRDFLVFEYKTRDMIAATSLPNGEEIYKRFIRIHTSSDFTAREIHDIGLCEVERINTQMEQISAELGYTNTPLVEANKLIKEDPKNYYANKEELLKGFEDIIQLVDSYLPKIFKRIPTFKIVMKSGPSPSTASAYYESPSYDGSKPGTFVVGTNNLKANPKYIMRTLTLHEASPGHHHQISHAIEFSGLPKFRRASIGTGQFLPSGFTSSTAYTEGWALYAETLGFDMGLYNDPSDRFGHYTDQLLRACRLVVDTGMHALGWTREQAIDFMVKNLPYERSSIVSEIDRYITWPGQALAYKIGQLTILNLREKAESKLKSTFDIKEFHEVILNLGSAPLNILEEEVDRYIHNSMM